ncbi:MAG: hypothetical protein DRH10_03655 [Deltaproteobacteria bacterium]|nr:MAG: hypothetical protein DRH10_03655 [Deltaproteobacteria bacterium]
MQKIQNSEAAVKFSHRFTRMNTDRIKDREVTDILLRGLSNYSPTQATIKNNRNTLALLKKQRYGADRPSDWRPSQTRA